MAANAGDRAAPPPAGDDLLWAEAALGHRFADAALLREALTHPSLGAPNYQRLEFLGDRVLGCAVAAWLYGATDDAPGDMNTRQQGTLVNGATCAAVALEIGAAARVRMERAAMNDGVHRSERVLADVMEALVGAVFVDGGFAAAEAAVRRAWGQRLSTARAAERDARNRLQEWAQGRGLRLPAYEVIEREGPDHAPRFRVRVRVTGHEPVEAMGATKQEAQRNAAASLLARVAR